MRWLPFDTETASLDGGVVEIAIVEIDEQCNVVGKLESLIDPERPISFGSGGVHGIRDEDVADAPTLKQFVDTFGNPFGGAEVTVIAYNAKFDVRVAAEILPSTARVMCALRIARALWPTMENHQLQTLAYAFRLKTGAAHRAMGDVVTLVSLLQHMMVETNLDLEGLYLLSVAPLSLDTYIWFGKHGPNGSEKAEPAGTKLRDLPKSYVRWYLSSADQDPDLQAVLPGLLAPTGRR